MLPKSDSSLTANNKQEKVLDSYKKALNSILFGSSKHPLDRFSSVDELIQNR